MYVVVNGWTLAVIEPGMVNHVRIVAVKGGGIPSTAPVPLKKTDRLRAADRADFADFRLNPKGLVG